jgi:hypothetical protein
MVDAPQTVLFVSPEEHRCPPMRAERLNESDRSVGRTKRNQIFAE